MGQVELYLKNNHCQSKSFMADYLKIGLVSHFFFFTGKPSNVAIPMTENSAYGVLPQRPSTMK